MWESKTSNDKLTHLDELLPSENSDLEKVISAKKEIKDSVLLSENQTEIIYVAAPIENEEDRKSTRLNSSHVAISYAVFCLKKKSILLHLSVIYMGIRMS